MCLYTIYTLASLVKVKAVVKAPPVAKQYDVRSLLIIIIIMKHHPNLLYNFIRLKLTSYILGRYWWVSRSIRIVDQCVERLINPLPENDSRHRLVEHQHTAGDQHVHRHLRRHSSEDEHFLTRIRMVRRIVQIFRPPHIVDRQTGIQVLRALFASDHNVPSPIQLTARRQQIQWICQQEKVLGTIDERRLVVLGLRQIQFSEFHDANFAWHRNVL